MNWSVSPPFIRKVGKSFNSSFKPSNMNHSRLFVLFCNYLIALTFIFQVACVAGSQVAMQATRNTPVCFNSGTDVQVENEVINKDGSRGWIGYCHGLRVVCSLDKQGQGDCKPSESKDVTEEESYFYDNAS